ncbi:MAG: alanine--tRNA ligase [Spirochaetes bacterium]|nr:alanine--tRNA ligase [Spirochaetota bacterium]
MVDASYIRESFLRYFEKYNHIRFPSSSLIPYDDPTLLFTNAGMNQFKKIFLGEIKSDLKRAISAQKCIRVSGKHNDLEEVGKDGRHHTFFEMLGNWSFGDYYKKEAIIWAWDYLTKELNLSKDRLYVSVYKDDEESYNIWKDVIGIEPSRIYKLGDIEKGDEENFWSMGDTGPCGPCTEIYYDQGPKVGCGRPECTLTCSCDRYLELWNLVFMEFNRDESGKLTPLPFKSVDTGMGLERITSIVQGVTSSYETDLFKPIIEEIEKISKKSFEDKNFKVPFQIILDHIRAIAFAIADGVIPSNEGRGYVIRRILRRASRQSRKLEIKEEFLYKLVDPLIEKMGNFYPELKENRDKIIHIIRDEERRFNKTLDNGLQIYEKIKTDLKKEGKNIIDGDKVFLLHDTYGFPVDLTRQIASEDNFLIDETGFYKVMEIQKDKSRVIKENLDLSKVMGDGWTVFNKRNTNIMYYDKYFLKTKINAINFDFDVEESFDIFFEDSVFYPLSGGQVSDIGIVLIKKDEITEEESNFIINKVFEIDIFEIDDEKRKNIFYSLGEEFVYKFYSEKSLLKNYIILFINDVFKTNYGPMHRGYIINTDFIIDEIKDKLPNLRDFNCFLIIDKNRRYNIMRNHTVTHLLHQSLYNNLGSHIKQAGSYVGSDILRFDFTHFEKIPDDKLFQIEKEVNDKISKDLKVTIYENIDIEDAKKMGAKALFEDKYADKVRVVKIDDYSIELCGGTHVPHTSFIQNFKILKEESISSGIRRIEAITGPAIYKYYKNKENIVKELVNLFSQKDEYNLIKKAKNLIEENKYLKKELQKYNKERIKEIFNEIKNSYQEVTIKNTKINLYSGVFEQGDIKMIRDFIDGIRTSDKNSIIIIGNIVDQNGEVVVSSSKEISELFSCSDILKNLAYYFEVRGGGRKDFATGGTKDFERMRLFFNYTLKNLKFDKLF